MYLLGMCFKKSAAKDKPPAPAVRRNFLLTAKRCQGRANGYSSFKQCWAMRKNYDPTEAVPHRTRLYNS